MLNLWSGSPRSSRWLITSISPDSTNLKTCNLFSKTLLLFGQRWLMELCGGLHHAVLGSQDWKHLLEIKKLTRERQPQTPQQPRTNTTSIHKRAQTHSTRCRKREQNSKSARNLQQTSTKPSHNTHAAFTLTDHLEKRQKAETELLNGFVCMRVCVCLRTTNSHKRHTPTVVACIVWVLISQCVHCNP